MIISRDETLKESIHSALIHPKSQKPSPSNNMKKQQ